MSDFQRYQQLQAAIERSTETAEIVRLCEERDHIPNTDPRVRMVRTAARNGSRLLLSEIEALNIEAAPQPARMAVGSMLPPAPSAVPRTRPVLRLIRGGRAE